MQPEKYNLKAHIKESYNLENWLLSSNNLYMKHASCLKSQ